MLTIVNQQLGVTALQVRRTAVCCALIGGDQVSATEREVSRARSDAVLCRQVKNAQGQWIDAKPIEGAFVCNIGAAPAPGSLSATPWYLGQLLPFNCAFGGP